MRVVFLAWTPGKRWPDRAYPEDLGRGGSSGSAGGAGEPVSPAEPLAGRGVTALGSPAVFPVSSCRASRERNRRPLFCRSHAIPRRNRLRTRQ
jgi:hypothetical protein